MRMMNFTFTQGTALIPGYGGAYHSGGSGEKGPCRRVLCYASDPYQENQE